MKADGRRGSDGGRAARVLLASAAIVAVWLAVWTPPVAAAKPVTGSFAVAQGAEYTTSPDVVLGSQVRGATQMRIKNSGGSFTNWQEYAPSVPWTLSAGDGLKTVDVQYRGVSGKRLTLSDTITLDSAGPETTSDYDGVPRRVVAVSLTATDAYNAVAGTWYRLDGGPWVEGQSTSLQAGHKRRGLHAGPHTLEFYSTDVLGNVGPVGSVVITLQY